MKKLIVILLFFVPIMLYGQKFKVYDTKILYSIKLAEINLKYGYPSKEYSKILGGKRFHFVCDTVVTRTYAIENPRETENKKYIFPVLDYIQKEFDALELMNYNTTWYKEEEIEEVIIKKL